MSGIPTITHETKGDESVFATLIRSRCSFFETVIPRKTYAMPGKACVPESSEGRILLH
jgi:hypothetical protein